MIKRKEYNGVEHCLQYKFEKIYSKYLKITTNIVFKKIIFKSYKLLINF